jgi:hypothetical protein
VWREIFKITCAGGAGHPQGAAPAAPPLPPAQAQPGADDPAATSADDAVDPVICARNLLWNLCTVDTLHPTIWEIR